MGLSAGLLAAPPPTLPAAGGRVVVVGRDPLGSVGKAAEPDAAVEVVVVVWGDPSAPVTTRLASPDAPVGMCARSPHAASRTGATIRAIARRALIARRTSRTLEERHGAPEPGDG